MKAVVFDMDGVLFDTERLCMTSWLEVAKEKGISDMETFFPTCIGRNHKDTLELFKNHYGEHYSYDDFRTTTSEWFWNHIKEKGLPIKPGVYKLLTYLKNDNFKIGLASSTKYSSVIKHLKEAKIIDFFDIIVTGDMIESSKPQPDIYLLACKKLGISPNEAYAIEDSPNGIRAAFSAQMKPIMVPDIILPDEEMKEKSILICEDLFSVMKFISQN